MKTKTTPRLWLRIRPTHISILRQEVRGVPPTISIKHPSLNTINRQLKKGSISLDVAKKLAQELMVSLRPPTPKRLFGGVNKGLIDTYWNEVVIYRRHEDPKGALNRLFRGVNCIGSLSLHVATKEQLIKTLDPLPVHKKREAVAVINQFLKYLGRQFSLPMPKSIPTEVSFLTERQFKKVITFVHDYDLKLFFGTLFYTGCRVGEAFALSRLQKGGRVVYIDRQIKRTGMVAGLKNKRAVASRRATIDKAGIEFVEAFVNLPKEVKDGMRNWRFCDLLQEAAVAAGVADGVKLTCNSLRHSYAIHWLEKGATITHVAQLLGNSESVCQRHYAGFTVKDIGIDALLSLGGV